MTIKAFLAQRNVAQYRLAKLAGLRNVTISDICSGKARIGKCSAETPYKIARVLGVGMEDLIAEQMESQSMGRSAFDVFKSNVCHPVKDQGGSGFYHSNLEKRHHSSICRSRMVCGMLISAGYGRLSVSRECAPAL